MSPLTSWRGNNVANDINNIGQIVGTRQSSGFADRGFFWENGTSTIIRTLGGENSVPLAINDESQVVGWSNIATGESHAFLWTK